jgi:2-oxoglutarate ferredoxin oxidoreductase subunit alpha
LIKECEIDPARMIPILHYDGTPITARFISAAIGARWRALAAKPQTEAAE